MNKKYIMLNAHGKEVYAVIPDAAERDAAFKKLFGFAEGCGYTAEVSEKEIKIVDYFGGSTVGRFEILSVVDTEDPTTDNFIENEVK